MARFYKVMTSPDELLMDRLSFASGLRSATEQSIRLAALDPAAPEHVALSSACQLQRRRVEYTLMKYYRQVVISGPADHLTDTIGDNDFQLTAQVVGVDFENAQMTLIHERGNALLRYADIIDRPAGVILPVVDIAFPDELKTGGPIHTLTYPII